MKVFFSVRVFNLKESTDTEYFNDTIYNRLSILLRSILCVSRVLPAYKYARNQNSESYVFLYHFYAHEPSSAALGNGFLSCPVSDASVVLAAELHLNRIFIEIYL